MGLPLVSVIMPTRNRARLVCEAIDSVLAQTLDDFELLIVDDASGDETPRVLATCAGSDQRLRLFRLSESGGANLARNRALQEARGRYVAFLDDDDIALPRRLEHTVARLEAEPSLDVVTTGFRFIDVEGRVKDFVPKGIPMGAKATDGAEVFELLYCDWAWMPTCTVTLRAELIAHNRYPEIRRRDGDSIFNCLLALSGATFAKIDEPLAYIRRDDAYASMSRNRQSLFADRRESLVFLRELLAQRGITRFDSLHARAWSNHLITEAEHFGGVRGLVRALVALRHSPRNRRARDYLTSRLLPIRLRTNCA